MEPPNYDDELHLIRIRNLEVIIAVGWAHFCGLTIIEEVLVICENMQSLTQEGNVD
jgi:hypothetical protein